jgi:hypothetical protein
MTHTELLALQRAASVALYGDDNGHIEHGPDCACETCQMERAADAAEEMDRE